MSFVADLTCGTVHGEVFIDAPREKVFRALTDPRRLAQWWGSAETYRTFDWRIDLRPGGEWSCQVGNPAQPGQSVRGEYRVVEPPGLLEYTWSPSWDAFATTLIRFELRSERTGTRLVLRHSGFVSPESCQGHAAGWELVVGWLVEKGLSD